MVLIRSRHMIRPLVQQIFLRILGGLMIALIWHRYMDGGFHSLGFGLQILGIIGILLVWFGYLRLDGVKVVRGKKKKEKKHSSSSMMDFVDEGVTSMADLDDEEKIACRMTANLIAGLLLLLMGFIG